MKAFSFGPRVFARIFGTGVSAEVVTRAARYLGGEIHDAIERSDQPVAKVRLLPGETYTVVARPRPTRRERKLSRTRASLAADLERRSRPNRSQLRAARKLSRAQRRLDRSRPGGRRNVRWTAREQRRGARFDRVMRPTRRQSRTAEALEKVTVELDELRAERFEAARRSVRPTRSVTFHD